MTLHLRPGESYSFASHDFSPPYKKGTQKAKHAAAAAAIAGIEQHEGIQRMISRPAMQLRDFFCRVLMGGSSVRLERLGPS